MAEDRKDDRRDDRKGGLFSRLFGGRPDVSPANGPAFDESMRDERTPVVDQDAASDRADAAAGGLPQDDGRADAVVGAIARTGWIARLRQGLTRSSAPLQSGIGALFTRRRLDAAMIEDLEDILIQADLGVDVSLRICKAVGGGRYDRDLSPADVKAILAAEVETVLSPVARPFVLGAARPFVIMMVGVNGSGKTTTIGKLSARFQAEGRSVMLAAGDTFRAAAVEQLKVWGRRTNAAVLAREEGADAAGLVFDAMRGAALARTDVLLVDTAGRLQNRSELMGELEKIVRVMRKVDASAPHAVLLVLDATVGQNALSQVEAFQRTAGVTGLVMTKLDGTARGGILVAIADRFGLPVHFIGVGEGVADLQSFEAKDFARAIAGLDEAA